MINVLNKICRGNQNTHFMLRNFFFFENHVFGEIMSKIMVEPERPQMAIWRRVACWISKATRAQAHARSYTPPPHIHTQERTRTQKHETLIGIPRRQRFRECASMLRFTQNVCLFVMYNIIHKYV